MSIGSIRKGGTTREAGSPPGRALSFRYWVDILSSGDGDKNQRPDASSPQISMQSVRVRSLALLPRLECSSICMSYCSLDLLGSSNPSTSASCRAGITGMHNCAWLIFVFLLEAGFRYVVQAVIFEELHDRMEKSTEPGVKRAGGPAVQYVSKQGSQRGGSRATMAREVENLESTHTNLR
ncbi:hypothetical protein AAY473_025749 [Plecturocebus cupreus]